MNSSFDAQTQKILDTLISKLPKDAHGFLVGGAVRDVLLNRPIHDFDIAYSGSIKPYAKKVADSLGASYFVLNEQFQTARVISTIKNQFSIDIVGMRGKTIEDDLNLRDFTINAMAFDLRNLGKLIDPKNGAKDLLEKRLKACSEYSFHDDPIRVLRAIRQSIFFGLRIDQTTSQLMKGSISDLSSMSSERIRDEFMRTLDLPNPVTAVNILDLLNILDLILPTVNISSLKMFNHPETKTNLWENIVLTMKNLLMLEQVLIGDYISGGARTLRGGEAVLQLGRYRFELQKVLEKQLHQDRRIRSLMVLACLFLNSHRLSNQYKTDGVKLKNFGVLSNDFYSCAKKLTLTNKEAKWGSQMVGGIQIFHDMATGFDSNRNDMIYRYFRILGDSGLLTCLLGLSETLTYEGLNGFEVRWHSELLFSKAVMEAYWEKHALIINPPLYLNGDEIKDTFKEIKPDQIGSWIERISEATASGLIHNKSDALRFIQEYKLNNSKKM
jgi:tRNA nucleotidyltransferase/poly(A) polymerase